MRNSRGGCSQPGGCRLLELILVLYRIISTSLAQEHRARPSVFPKSLERTHERAVRNHRRPPRRHWFLKNPENNSDEDRLKIQDFYVRRLPGTAKPNILDRGARAPSQVQRERTIVRPSVPSAAANESVGALVCSVAPCINLTHAIRGIP